MSFKGTKIQKAPTSWKHSCVHTECTLNQISPFIGKLKSKIARDLILTHTSKNDLIVDPFAGSGTIPLEALLNDRNAFAVDNNPYARVLCLAKLHPPESLEKAIKRAESILEESENLRNPDLRKVPPWVRAFFHPQTLKEILKFSHICKRRNEYFLFAALLGILHHQRPGFLSYPSSHLVPYLRDKKFPRNHFPELYDYREITPRMISKIKRIYRRFDPIKVSSNKAVFSFGSIINVALPDTFDCLITSPPYMNALDYNRDNRLRLWFTAPDYLLNKPVGQVFREKEYIKLITILAKQMERSLKFNGFCLFIVGDKILRSPKASLSELTLDLLKRKSPSLELQRIIKDDIPDVRRSRRNCRATKTENILIYRKTCHA